MLLLRPKTMLVVWLLLTLNLVLVHCSELQQPVPICDKDSESGGKCVTESLGNTTTTTTPSTTTLSTTPIPLTTESSSNNSSTSTKSSLSNSTEPNDGGGQIILKPQTDEGTVRNSSNGRAMNFDMQEHQPPDGHTAKSEEKGSLQDLSLDDIDEISVLPTLMHEDKMNTTKFDATVPSPFLSNFTSTSSTSTEGPASTTVSSSSSNVTMVNGSSCVQGQKFERGCSETCECGFDGKAVCRPRCSIPFFRRGELLNDPACIAKLAEDPCCSLLVCTQDTETEPLEGCTYKNQSYQRGDTFDDGCVAVCTCGKAGQVVCKPRCPAAHNSSTDRCVELPDPTDPCCTVVLCDVTLGDHDVNKAGVEDGTGLPHLQLLNVEVVNSTTARLVLAGEPQSKHENLTVEASDDQKTWKHQDSEGLLVQGLEPGLTYYLRVKSGSMVSNAVEVSLPTSETQQSGTAGCQYKGQHYVPGEEFHDGCEAYCACTESGVQCANLECPTDFGLDVLDPSCVEWETHPPDFKPSPPYCCPEQVRCKNNGSCVYEGQHFNNWAEIPMKLTGCSKRCYCEYGNVSCQSTCPPVSNTPPSDLQCEPHQAMLSHLPGEDCCFYWLCPQLQHSGSNVTVMHDRPTGQRQPANNTATYDASPDQHFGPVTPAGVAVKSEHKDAFLPLNPDYMPPSLLPILEPLEHNDEHPSHNHSMNNLHAFQQKDSNTKDGPNKFPEDYKPTQPIPINASETPHDIDSIQITTTTTTTTTEISKILETKEEKQSGSSDESHHPEHKDVYKTEEKLEPYHVKPPFLPEHEGTLDDSEQPVMWIPPQDHEGNSKYHENTRHSELNKPPVDNPRYGTQNHLSPGGYFIPPNRRPVLGPGEGLQVPPLPGPPEIQQQNPSPGHQVDVSSDPHLDQILMHLQKQGILPEHYTIVQQQEGPPSHRDIPQQHRIQTPSQSEGTQRRPNNAPVYEIDSDDIPIHLSTGRIPPQYNQGYVPKSIPRPEQRPPFYQTGIRRPQPNDPRNVAPFPLDSSKYPNQPGRQPDTDGPPVAHVPYQGLLLPHQYHGLSYVPPHVDIDHLLLTAQGRHNQSQPGFLEQHLPPGFQEQGPVGRSQDEITVHTLEAVDEHTVKLVFSVSPVLVGLHGRVELRYTPDEQNNDPSTWNQQVLAPPGDLIATPQLEFELGDLIPDTQYNIKITVILRDLHNSPTSKILSVRTPPAAVPLTTLPPQIPVDLGLSVADVNATWARLMWRKFTEFELQFIDGVQLRYKEKEGKVYAATPLIHRAVTSYTLEDLRPHTEYEVRIFLIPFPGQTTELIAERTTELLTADVHDLYKFNVTLELQHIKSTSVELSWTGVPYPEDKYVNIFRAIYQSDAGKEDFSTFKVAKRDSQARTVIHDLKPGTRYRLWLEVYLTNGKIKKSNVQDFITKPGSVPSVGATQQGKLKGEDPEPLVETADYYGPLVAVAIIAALAIVAALILLLILMKKHGHNKAAISATRKSQSAYDNPSYKTSDNDPVSAANGSSATKTVEQP